MTCLFRLRASCAQYWKPAEHLSFDECSIGVKNKKVAEGMKRFNKSKSHTFLIMVFALCAPDGRYVHNFHLPLGKEIETATEDVPAHHVKIPKNANPVLRCIKPFVNRGVKVALDSFYMSLPLVEECMRHNTYIYGTIRQNRVGVPFFTNSKGNDLQDPKFQGYNLYPGELWDNKDWHPPLSPFKHFASPPLKLTSQWQRGEWDYRLKGQISAVLWNDKKSVSGLSTFHTPFDQSGSVFRWQRQHMEADEGGDNVLVPSQRAEQMCPQLFTDYNQCMGGCDSFDQRRKHYSTQELMRVRKWWKSVVLFLFDVAFTNSWSVYNALRHTMDSTFKPVTYSSYMQQLCDELVQDWMASQILGRKRKRESVSSLPQRLVGCDHLVAHRAQARRCHYCWHQFGLDRKSKYYCKGCEVHLHVYTELQALNSPSKQEILCFNRWHTDRLIGRARTSTASAGSRSVGSGDHNAQSP